MQCTNLRANQTLKMASQQKTDKRMIAACLNKLIAKEVYYRQTCYQNVSRDIFSSRSTEKQSGDDSSAFKKVTIQLSIHVENPDTVELSKLTGILESQPQE